MNVKHVRYSGNTFSLSDGEEKRFNGFKFKNTDSGEQKIFVKNLPQGIHNNQDGFCEETGHGFGSIKALPDIDTVLVGYYNDKHMLIVNPDNPRVLASFINYYAYDDNYIWLECEYVTHSAIPVHDKVGRKKLFHIPSSSSVKTSEPPERKSTDIFKISEDRIVEKTSNGFEEVRLDKDEDDVETNTTELWDGEVETTRPERDLRETPKRRKNRLLDKIINQTAITNREDAKIFLHDEIDEVMSNTPDKGLREAVGEGRQDTTPETDLREELDEEMTEDELRQIRDNL